MSERPKELSNVRDYLGWIIGRKVVDVTADDPNAIPDRDPEDGDTGFIMLHFDNHGTLAVPLTEAGLSYENPWALMADRGELQPHDSTMPEATDRKAVDADRPTLSAVDVLPSGTNTCRAVMPGYTFTCDLPRGHEGLHQAWSCGVGDSQLLRTWRQDSTAISVRSWFRQMRAADFERQLELTVVNDRNEVWVINRRGWSWTLFDTQQVVDRVTRPRVELLANGLWRLPPDWTLVDIRTIGHAYAEPLDAGLRRHPRVYTFNHAGRRRYLSLLQEQFRFENLLLEGSFHQGLGANRDIPPNHVHVSPPLREKDQIFGHLEMKWRSYRVDLAWASIPPVKVEGVDPPIFLSGLSVRCCSGINGSHTNLCEQNTGDNVVCWCCGGTFPATWVALWSDLGSRCMACEGHEFTGQPCRKRETPSMHLPVDDIDWSRPIEGVDYSGFTWLGIDRTPYMDLVFDTTTRQIVRSFRPIPPGCYRVTRLPLFKGQPRHLWVSPYDEHGCLRLRFHSLPRWIDQRRGDPVRLTDWR
jgi:hypothetical protein